MQQLNMNNHVYVKVTEAGHKHIKELLGSAGGNLASEIRYIFGRAPRLSGYLGFQMYDLFVIFGGPGTWLAGKEPLFETNIYTEDCYVKEGKLPTSTVTESKDSDPSATHPHSTSDFTITQEDGEKAGWMFYNGGNCPFYHAMKRQFPGIEFSAVDFKHVMREEEIIAELEAPFTMEVMHSIRIGNEFKTRITFE